MQYAEIVEAAIAQLIATEAPLPAHKLRPDLLPVEDVVPAYDADTHVLGAETLTIEVARVVRSWEVVEAPPPPIPQVVSAPQARVALLRAGLLASVNALVASQGADSEVGIFWEYEINIHRSSPTLAMMTAALGLSAEQVDDLFRQAAAITP